MGSVNFQVHSPSVWFLVQIHHGGSKYCIQKCQMSLSTWNSHSCFKSFLNLPQGCVEFQWSCPLSGGWGTRMVRGGIRLVHGLTKNTLIMYYSGMKKDPKNAFLHAFFLICLSCSFPKFVYMAKNTPFFPILHVFAPLNDVRAYSAWSWKTPLITWIFGRAWYPPWHSSAPPGPLYGLYS